MNTISNTSIDIDSLSRKQTLSNKSLGLINAGQSNVGAQSKNMNAPKQFRLFRVNIQNCTMNEAVSLLIGNAIKKVKTNVAFVNADCLNKAWQFEQYQSVLGKMHAVFPDGIGVKIAAKMKGVNVTENVNGTDLFPLLCEHAAENKLSIFLLGARPGVASQCAKNMQKKFPSLHFAGTCHGYYDTADTDRLIHEINISNADILIVAFGAPKQEFWMNRYTNKLKPSIRIGVGGCLDFYAERIPRAPLIMRKASLEWVWRLIQEPARMWRRYLIGNPLFLFRAWKMAHR